MNVLLRYSRTACAAVLLSAACADSNFVSSEADPLANATHVYDSEVLTRLPDLKPSLKWHVGRDSAGATIAFERIRDMAMDEWGRTYVLDTPGISVLSADGSLVRTFGPAGPGPAELKNARSIAVGGDTVFVLDNTLKLFTTAGEYLDQVEPEAAEFLQSSRIVHTDSGLAIFRDRHGVFRNGETVRSDTLEIRMLDIAGERRQTFPVQAFGRSTYRVAPGVTGPLRMGSPVLVSVTHDGQTLVPDPEFFGIDVWSARSTKLERIAAEVPRVAASDTDFDDLFEEYARFLKLDGAASRRYARSFREAPRARYRPVIWAIIPSRTGHLLVERRDLGVRPYNPYDPRSRKVWHVIAPDWEPVGTVTLPGRFRPKVFTGCTIIGYETDDMDAVMVARYDLGPPLVHLCLGTEPEPAPR